MVKPTPDEERNGWTEETLTAYLEKQATAQAASINNEPDPMFKRGRRRRDQPAAEANHRYNPHRWR
jgi:hypothetical protein